MNNSNDNPVNAICVSPSFVFMNTYFDIVSNFCNLNQMVINANADMLRNKISDEEKVISLDSLVYLACNLGAISSLMIINYHDIRNRFAEFLEKELSVDNMNAEQRVKYRSSVSAKTPMPVTNYITLGVTTFSENVFTQLIDMANDGYAKYFDTDLSAEVDKKGMNLTESDKNDIGVLLSNYGYILRCANYNSQFLLYLEKIINDADAEFHIG